MATQHGLRCEGVKCVTRLGAEWGDIPQPDQLLGTAASQLLTIRTKSERPDPAAIALTNTHQLMILGIP